MAGKDSVLAELLEFLRDWWIHHILEEDMQYRSFFVERGVKKGGLTTACSGRRRTQPLNLSVMPTRSAEQ